MDRKVVILPCSGIGKPTGEIGRQAAYHVVRQLRPEKTGMVCLARLVVEDPAAIALLQDNYVITLDGCPDDCAQKNVERLGKSVDCALHVADLLDQHPDLHPTGIVNLGDDGLKLVQLMTDQVVTQVDQMIARED